MINLPNKRDSRAKKLAKTRKTTAAVIKALDREVQAGPLATRLAKVAEKAMAKAGASARLITEDERDAMWIR